MTAPATSRTEHVAWQRNLACAGFEALTREIGRLQVVGALSLEVAIELNRMASDEVTARLAELDAFVAREQPSRLRHTEVVRQGLHQVGGGQ